MNMRLLGAPTIKDVVPDMVDARSISTHVVAVPGDRLYDSNCQCPRLGCATVEKIDSAHRRQHAERDLERGEE